MTDLGLFFPPGVFALSHLAIPFPLSEPLYGLEPDTSEDCGANLGAMATRGERGTLIVSIRQHRLAGADILQPLLRPCDAAH